jgi:hypothetical protein
MATSTHQVVASSSVEIRKKGIARLVTLIAPFEYAELTKISPPAGDLAL